jgi:hypothetical protein
MRQEVIMPAPKGYWKCVFCVAGGLALVAKGTLDKDSNAMAFGGTILAIGGLGSFIYSIDPTNQKLPENVIPIDSSPYFRKFPPSRPQQSARHSITPHKPNGAA